MGQSFHKVKIIAVGKVKQPWIKEGVQRYAKRLPEVEIIEIKDSGKEKEAGKLLSLLKSQERLVEQLYRAKTILQNGSYH